MDIIVKANRTRVNVRDFHGYNWKKWFLGVSSGTHVLTTEITGFTEKDLKKILCALW
jgi:hypothetical protein